MPIPSYFTDFLSNIRPTKHQRDELITGHTTLRNRLRADENLAPLYVSDFLQGSYRRATAVKPTGGKRSDVDVIVVTRIDRATTTPEEALQCFIPFMEKHYRDKYELQGRSIGIKLSYVELDVVITSAPSEVEEARLQAESVTTRFDLESLADWRLVGSWLAPDHRTRSDATRLLAAAAAEAEWNLSPLWIPDRDAAHWVETHPLEQIRWTWNKNRETNRHYVNVVKALKWWRLVQLSDLKYPKGYPIEHMIGDCCPNGIGSVAEGITRTLETIRDRYEVNRLLGTTPVLPDRGVPAHNVWGRITGEEFAEFYDNGVAAAVTARTALEATSIPEKVRTWRELFGNEFPPPPENGGGRSGSTPPAGGYSERAGRTTIGGGRFA
jgi:hypothetical protein